MSEPLFTGVGVALATLFDEAGEADAKATAGHAATLVELGVRAVVVAGSTGEAAALTSEEHITLLTETRKAVGSEVPVVAGGGIATARGVAACLAAGASGVRVGTRLLATEEAGAHPAYVAALLAAGAEDAVLTDAFSVMWPPGPEPHRTLRSALEAAEAFGGEVVGETRMGDRALPVPRFGVPCPNRDTTGEIAAMVHYAGQGVGATDRVLPAAQVVTDLVDEAERLLRRWG